MFYSFSIPTNFLTQFMFNKHCGNTFYTKLVSNIPIWYKMYHQSIYFGDTDIFLFVCNAYLLICSHIYLFIIIHIKVYDWYVKLKFKYTQYIYYTCILTGLITVTLVSHLTIPSLLRFEPVTYNNCACSTRNF